MWMYVVVLLMFACLVWQTELYSLQFTQGQDTGISSIAVWGTCICVVVSLSVIDNMLLTPVVVQEDDLKKAVEESACLQRAYDKYVDQVIVNEDFDITFRKVVEALDTLSAEHQWVPVNWIYWHNESSISTYASVRDTDISPHNSL